MSNQFIETRSWRRLPPAPLATIAAVVAAIFFVGSILRFAFITSRPLHPDEGVNHFFVSKIFELGYYPYSHENYHGPLFHYLNAAAVALTGESELSLRLISILLGIALFLVPLCFHKTIGVSTALISSALLALSPSMVFHSRYAIHETSFILWQLLLALVLLRHTLTCADENKASINHKIKGYYAIGLLAAALIATKETFLIAFFCLSLSFLSVPKARTQLFNLLSMCCEQERQQAYRAFVVSFTVLVAIFTAGFRWPRGCYELSLAAVQWLERGTTTDPAHFKSFGYYIQNLILPLEPQLLIIPLLGAIILRRRFLDVSDNGGSDRRFFAVWSVSSFIVYSAIPYKTPWLVINLTLPLLLLAAATLARIFTEISSFRLKQLAVLVILLVEGAESINLNFQSVPLWGSKIELAGYSLRNPFSYGHTTADTLRLAEQIKRYYSQYGGKILVSAPLYWPLPYYLRELAADVSYYTTFTPEKYADRFNIIVADDRTRWQPPEFDRELYKITDIQPAWVFFRRNGTP